MAEELVVTDIEDIPDMVAGVREFFQEHKTLDLSFRQQQLQAMQKMLKDNRGRVLEAMRKDLNKSEMEAVLMECSIVENDLARILDDLEELMAPQPQPKDLLNKFNSVYLQPEPYGVVLIIAPWNYPFQLVMLPLIGAIAAGNTCVVKASESSVATSNLIREILPQYISPKCCAVITGDVEVSKAVMKERYDYIFYTGSTNVGRLVMKQAAENITPVTLELGGKSPVLLAPDANIEVAARRIMWGKFTNSGQTCIAPDYILYPRDKKEQLLEACKKTIREFYGEDPQQSNDYGRIINAAQFSRLVGLLKDGGGTVVCGGEFDESSRYIAPTLIADVTVDDKIMKDEIFGPLLPFVAVEGVEEAIKIVNSREKPLAFYVFTEKRATFEFINKRTSAGGVTHNDTIMHAGVPSLPFGGVGHSGIGAYHGKYTFKTFSHYKPVLSVGTGMEALNKMRYPPFSNKKLKRLQWFLSPSTKSRFPWKMIALFCMIALVAVLVQTYGLPGWLYRITN